jgi:eukaryotic-like serine/threonine-protein kinase
VSEARESSGMRYGAIERADAIARGSLVANGRYRVGAVIGRGGMAMVYAATRVADGVDVALKVAAGPYADRPDLAQRMQNEQGFAAQLAGHPNLVRPLDGGRLAEQGDAPYLVTELVRGPALTDLIVMQRQLAPARATAIALDVARALAALHERGIVHRDVKPDNIVIAKTVGVGQQAKLIDFGLAAKVDTGESVNPRLTAVFERPGTKHYMAPEQAVGARPATSFDVYALGVTLFEMLIGTPPFGERSAEEAVARKLAGDLPSFSIAGLREDLPDLLVEVVDGCLQRDPTRRIATLVLVEKLARAAEVLRRERPSGADSDLGVSDAEFDVRASSEVAGVGTRKPAADRTSRHRVVVLAAIVAVTAGVGSWAAGILPSRVEQPSAAHVEDADATADRPLPVASPDVEPAPTKLEAESPVPTPSPAMVSPPPSEPATKPSETAAPPVKRSGKPRVIPPQAEGPMRPIHEGATCTAARARANTAERTRKWRDVLDATDDRSCWPDAAERRRARVSAYFALADYQACVREARGSKHADILDYLTVCESKVKTP